MRCWPLQMQLSQRQAAADADCARGQAYLACLAPLWAAGCPDMRSHDREDGFLNALLSDGVATPGLHIAHNCASTIATTDSPTHC